MNNALDMLISEWDANLLGQALPALLSLLVSGLFILTYQETSFENLLRFFAICICIISVCVEILHCIRCLLKCAGYVRVLQLLKASQTTACLYMNITHTYAQYLLTEINSFRWKCSCAVLKLSALRYRNAVFIFMHLEDAFFYLKQLSSHTFDQFMHSLENKPMTWALLEPCSSIWAL